MPASLQACTGQRRGRDSFGQLFFSGGGYLLRERSLRDGEDLTVEVNIRGEKEGLEKKNPKKKRKKFGGLEPPFPYPKTYPSTKTILPKKTLNSRNMRRFRRPWTYMDFPWNSPNHSRKFHEISKRLTPVKRLDPRK